MYTKRWLGILSIVILCSSLLVHPVRAETISVNSLDDVLDAAADCASVTLLSLPGPNGKISLREAICAANNHEGPDTIAFNLLPCFAACKITPTSQLPILTDDETIIDGYSHNNAHPATSTSPAILVMEINWELPGVLANGLVINSANNQVRGLIINGFSVNGIAIAGAKATNNIISGNYIGTDYEGMLDKGNAADGVYIGLGASGNTIGGNEPAERNVISSNGWEGIGIHGNGTTDNTISGNYIGTNAIGEDELGNSLFGVRIYGGAANNTIGGDTLGSRNVISNNLGDGIRIVNAGTDGNTVINNFIGMLPTLDNGSNVGHGIYIGDGAQNNHIGLDITYGGNVIAFNREDGIHITGSGTTDNVIKKNMIGTDPTGFYPAGNQKNGVCITDGAQSNHVGGFTPGERNIISSNGSSGISIEGTETMNNTVSANYIGVDISGSYELGNRFSNVSIGFNASYNTIGGTTPGERNIISASWEGSGILISGDESTGNKVLGNFIGTNATGDLAIGNASSGVIINDGAHENWIGGYEPGSGNLISGNHNNGVYISDYESFSNYVVGNTIGASFDRRNVLENDSHGVAISASPINIIEDNLIGGNSSNGVYIVGPNAHGTWVQGNIIGGYYNGVDLISLGNGANGVYIKGPFIGSSYILTNQIAGNTLDGVRVEGEDVIKNEIQGNRIYHNLMGIRLVDGANGGIEAPTITGTQQGSVLVEGMACSGCRVEIFGNDTPENQGQRYLGSTAADSTGSFTASITFVPRPYIYLTATATDSDLGTSEFSEIFLSTVIDELVFMPLVLRSP